MQQELGEETWLEPVNEHRLIAAPGALRAHSMPRNGASPERRVSVIPWHRFGAFPAPSSLAGKPVPRHGSCVEADLEENGANFAPALPNNLAAANVSACGFSSAYIAGSGLTGAAYCVYSFSVLGYDRTPGVRYTWSSAPVARPARRCLATGAGQGTRWPYCAVRSRAAEARANSQRFVARGSVRRAGWMPV